MAKKKTLQRLALRNNRPVPVRLKSRFSLNDEQHVGAFLRQHPAVVEVLNALPPLAEHAFPEYKDIRISIVSDPDGLESDFIEAMVRVESFEQTQAAVARHVAVFDEKIFPHTMLVWDAAVNAHLNVGVALC